MDIKDTNSLNKINIKEVSAGKNGNSEPAPDKKPEKIDLSFQKVLDSYGRAAVSFGRNKSSVSKADKKAFKKMLQNNPKFVSRYISDILKLINEDNKDIAAALINDLSTDIRGFRFSAENIISILKHTDVEKKEYIKKIIEDDYKSSNSFYRFTGEYIADIIQNIKEYNKEIFDILYEDKSTDYKGNLRFDEIDMLRMLRVPETRNEELLNRLLNDNSQDLYGNFRFPGHTIADILEPNVINEENKELFYELLNLKDTEGNYRYNGKGIFGIIKNLTPENKDLLEMMINDDRKDNNGDLRFDGEDIANILYYAKEDNIDFIYSMINDNSKDKEGNFRFNGEFINYISSMINNENKDFAEELINLKGENNQYVFDGFEILTILDNDSNNYDVNKIKSLIARAKKGRFLNILPLFIMENYFELLGTKDYKLIANKIKELEEIIGKSKLEQLSANDICTGILFKEFALKNDINEIPAGEKKNILRKLIAYNAALFQHSDEFKKNFPLLPKNQEEYCEFLPNLVKSLGIETNELSQSNIDNTYKYINKLSDALKTLSDEDFNNLSINQEYSSEDLIKDTYNIVKDLPDNERQEVFDYFGFELYKNPNGTKIDNDSEKRFSIKGYPVNLNNGKKLAQINEPSAKTAIEKLRPYVIKFSQDNKITSNNKEVETYLNNIVSSFPELRTAIGKQQHDAHYFDVFKHSLKVMQKISQNPDVEKLNNSDKNLLLLASLFHDITKPEGHIDKTHANESAFDSYYILKKLKLSKNEEIKLYSLIKHHEWFAFVNNKKTKNRNEKEKRFQSAAFDLQYDNLFDLAKIFTIADLKAVKNNDGFFNKFKADFEPACKKISNYIAELQKTQPLLPVTPIPKASTIDKAITKVNADGSTNFKGIYKNKDGLIIIKFNEVENETWEKIGFPKGSCSKGIDAKGKITQCGKVKLLDNVNTGNIKFFAHGLDYPNQLTKFDVFALPDSDALLSVSYTERPESKYRFFRTQGVLLNTPTKYMHGGGNTDGGSGCGKDINTFKNNYLFGGERETDRKYISNLIKDALNMSDKEYIKFVKQNADKPFSEIYPEETRNKIIKAFSLINSNTRKGNRAYNEMYITNPEVMGVYAYSFNDNVGEVITFVDKQKDFLKTYALQHDLPFFVFGD